MPVTIKTENNIMTALIDGDIDHHSARQIRENIDTSIINCRPFQLYLDFNGVSFMDSSGVGLILGRYKLMKSVNGTVKVVNCPPIIDRMLKLAGLKTLNLLED